MVRKKDMPLPPRGSETGGGYGENSSKHRGLVWGQVQDVTEVGEIMLISGILLE